MEIDPKIKEKVRRLPQGPGVYLMRDQLGKVIYIGKAINLKKRVGSYFGASRRKRLLEEQPKIAAMVTLIRDIEVITVKNEAEALILESKLIKQWKPRYNSAQKDDKRYYMVCVDLQNELPQFRLTRNRVDRRALYYGPFVNSLLLKKTLKQMRARFGIMLGDTKPVKLENGQYKLYDDIRGEIYGHPNEVDSAAYREWVREACKYLEGQAREWIDQLEDDMVKAAESKEYEKAAQARDMIYALRKTLEPTRKFKVESVLHHRGGRGVEALREALGMDGDPEVIECFDISHISGSFVVASMVYFKGGMPDKRMHRRFKIKGFEGNDDYQSMEEVVRRRYQRLRDENKAFPDLIVIDGGRGQVGAALKAFVGIGAGAPFIVGLAKREETIVFGNGDADLKLPRDHAALRLLQRIRDEAHRFANQYNADLRSRSLRESILDLYEGVGPKKKAALFEHFKTIEAMRKASEEELAKAPGIGPKLAEGLYVFLRENK